MLTRACHYCPGTLPVPLQLAARSPPQLCAWVEGRHAPLSGLVEQLLPLLPAGSDPVALRTLLIDLAQRRSYAAKEGEQLSTGAAGQ